MEQQQSQQTKSLGESAIMHVATERFAQRQKVLEYYFESGKLPNLEGTLPLRPGTKLAEGATVATLRAWLEQFVPLVHSEARQTIDEALKKLCGDAAAENVQITGEVHGYNDHPDNHLRIELQINRALDWTSEKVIPDLVLTFALHEHLDLPGAIPIWTVMYVKEGRVDWLGMPMVVPKKGVASDNKHGMSVDPAAMQVPSLRDIFISHDKRLGMTREVPAVSSTEQSGAQIAQEPIAPTGNATEDDGMMVLFAPSPEKLAQMGQPKQALPLGVQQAELFGRGYPMSKMNLVAIDGLALNIRTRDDVKYFLDEVFRNGNLWLHGQIEAALKANEQGSITEEPLVFELVVKGNWQENFGPIDAKIKLKAFWEKDAKHEHKLFTISGSMQI